MRPQFRNLQDASVISWLPPDSPVGHVNDIVLF